MKYNLPFIVMALLVAVTVNSQSKGSIDIRGTLNVHICARDVLFKSFSDDFEPISITLNKDNSFGLSLPSDITAGIYRVQYNQDCGNQFVDIIINGRDKQISFVVNSDNDFAIFAGSEENKGWSRYRLQSQALVAKLEVLYNFLSFYPVTKDEVVRQVTEAVSHERKKYYENFEFFIKNNKGSWAEKMVANQPYYFSDPTAVPTRRDFVRHDYYWDGINANDPTLINTPLYITLIDDYFGYNGTNDDTAAEREKIFNINAAVIMEKFSHNLTTKSFTTDYLKEKRSQMKRE
jgi:hypothetical protein